MDCLPNDGDSVGKSERTAPSEVVTPVSRVYLNFQNNLKKYLEHAGKLSTDDVCNWILVCLFCIYSFLVACSYFIDSETIRWRSESRFHSSLGQCSP